MWSMINLATNYASIKMHHHIQLQNKPDSSALISSPHTPPAPHKAQQEGLSSPFMEDRPLLTSPPPRSQSSTPRRTHSTNTQAHDEWHLAFYLSQGHSTHQIQSLPSVSLSLSLQSRFLASSPAATTNVWHAGIVESPSTGGRDTNTARRQNQNHKHNGTGCPASW